MKLLQIHLGGRASFPDPRLFRLPPPPPRRPHAGGEYQRRYSSYTSLILTGAPFVPVSSAFSTYPLFLALVFRRKQIAHASPRFMASSSFSSAMSFTSSFASSMASAISGYSARYRRMVSREHPSFLAAGLIMPILSARASIICSAVYLRYGAGFSIFAISLMLSFLGGQSG